MKYTETQPNQEARQDTDQLQVAPELILYYMMRDSSKNNNASAMWETSS